jgi:hypothetical protein
MAKLLLLLLMQVSEASQNYPTVHPEFLMMDNVPYFSPILIYFLSLFVEGRIIRVHKCRGRKVSC